ncbi:MAG TPA: hypothetical protein VFX49_20790 [Chloroflexota bacterium]|nr:hypothetical protein [Chloroflexota bacterium]
MGSVPVKAKRVAGTFRPMRDVDSLLAELDAAIADFAARRPTAGRRRGAAGADGEGEVRVYLDRLFALLEEDLPHSTPPEIQVARRRN